MADWDSADLLARLRTATGRPATDQDLTDAKGYEWLSEAQLECARELAIHVPELNWAAPEALTTSDNKVYTLTGKAWVGSIEVYRDSTLKGQPLRAGSLWDCSRDYTLEGENTIRLTCGRTKAFSPYVRYNPKPGKIAAGGSNEPTLNPVEVRQAVVYLAAAMWASKGGYRDPAGYYTDYGRVLRGVDGQTGLIGEAKRRRQQGVGSGGAWFRSPDLGGR